MNNVVISGTLGKDVKIVELENNIKVFNNTVCITEQSNDDKYTWINIVAYEELAEYIAKNYRMSDYVIVQGKLKTRTWIDSNTNEKRYLTEVLIYRIEGVE
jgi:single-strand DNA-binding protein